MAELDWRTAAQKLLSEYGKVRPYSTRDFGRDRHAGAVSVVIEGGGPQVAEFARDVLTEVRAALPKGCVAWLGTTRWLGDEQHPDKVELAIAEGSSQFDILRHAASDAINYGLETEDLVKQLTAYDEQHGIDIFHAETDTIEFDVTGEVDDWAAFAKDLYKFCPDIVDQGVGSVDALEATLAETGSVYLWWD
ncbi:MAG: DUF4253 domain-containing protein [Myxococcota bacterium]